MVCDELAAGVLCDYDYSNTSKLEERYLNHYKTLGQFDKRRVLRYRVQEGWRPLCEFLMLPVPDRPFPKLNDAKDLQELSRQAWWTAVRNSLRNVVGGFVVILLTSVAVVRFTWLSFIS